jgi:hypothetical protein
MAKQLDPFQGSKLIIDGYPALCGEPGVYSSHQEVQLVFQLLIIGNVQPRGYYYLQKRYFPPAIGILFQKPFESQNPLRYPFGIIQPVQTQRQDIDLYVFSQVPGGVGGPGGFGTVIKFVEIDGYGVIADQRFMAFSTNAWRRATAILPRI